MADAPERIGRFDYGEGEIIYAEPGMITTGQTNYIRADLVDELVKALEPFVDALEGNDDSNIRDSAEIWEAPLAMNITYGHLRRAHAALTRIKGDGK